MIKLNIQLNEDYLHTHIPNIFIDNHMHSADPIFSLIYIYLLRHGDADAAQIAQVFDITERKCVKALKYWEQEGLLSLDIPAKPARKSRAAERDKEQELFMEPAVETDDETIAETADKPSQLLLDTQLHTPIKRKQPIRITEQERPSYTTQELEEYGKQEIIADLFEYAQDRLGRMLRYNDLNVLFSMYDWMRLDIDVIKTLLDYCSDNGHSNISYIESVALDWAARGIKTTEDALDYIKMYTKTYREILRALGITGRSPAPKEMQYMDKWLGEYGMSLEIVLEACDRTVMKNTKTPFKYLNSIIEAWHKADVKTLEDISRVEDAFAGAQMNKPDSTVRRKSSFSNFDGRKIDYSEIERLEEDYISKIILNTATG